MPENSRIQDLTGQRFGRLTVTGYGGRKGTNHVWLCRCDCGGDKLAQAGNMRAGLTQSCGCLQRERASAATRTHGHTVGRKSSEYRIWVSMICRCRNENDAAYAYYGGRGIAVCERWANGEGGLSGFECFFADMGRRPDRRSLDRIDNDKGYSPDNCRWATRREQALNVRTNVIVRFRGEERLLADVCALTGVPVNCARQRIKTYGWSVEKAVTTPSKSPGQRKRRQQGPDERRPE